MADDKDFRNRIQQIGGLVQQVEGIADPAVKATTKELVQLLMELHGSGLERMLEITFQAGDAGTGIIDELGRDPLVSSLLVLYGLHPEEMQTRLAKALERIRPSFRKQGGGLELLSVDDGVVRIRVETGSNRCGSTAKSLRSTIEEAVYDAAPDITSLSIEGLDGQAASGFVALDKLMGDFSVPIAGEQTSAPRMEGAD